MSRLAIHVEPEVFVPIALTFLFKFTEESLLPDATVISSHAKFACAELKVLRQVAF